METQSLRALLLELMKLVNERTPDADSIEEADDILENNYLDEDDNVPTWLLDMFQALVEQRQASTTPMTTDSGENASPTNFLVEIQDLLDMVWVEYGEYFLMQFPAIGLEAKVSAEENAYSVRKISGKATKHSS